MDLYDAVCDFILAEQDHTFILVRSMADEDVDEITLTPWDALAPTA